MNDTLNDPIHKCYAKLRCEASNIKTILPWNIEEFDIYNLARARESAKAILEVADEIEALYKGVTK